MKRIIAAFSIAMMVCGSAAWADKPEQYPIGPFQITGEQIADCGDFLALKDFRIEGYQRIYFNNDGTPNRIFYSLNYDGVYYNSNDPSYWLEGKAEHQQAWTHFENGVPTKTAQVGPQIKVTVPGYGAVLIEGAGRLVYDYALGQFVLVAGRHDIFYGNTAAFCAALRP